MSTFSCIVGINLNTQPILCLTLLFSIAAIVLTLKLNFTAPKTNAPVVSVEVVVYNNCTVFLQQKTLEAGHTVETIIHTTNVRDKTLYAR